MTSRILQTAVPVAMMATLVACQGGGGAPELDPVDPQAAQVGVQLSLTLQATDPNGDPLDFAFDSTIPTIQDRATMTRSPAGNAIWRWTPLAADVGTWYVDFTVSDGSSETTETVEIDVSAAGAAGAPIFRSPLGTGTTLDLASAMCIDVPVVVDDQDSTSVTITQTNQLIDGATLTMTDAMSATWHWCPSAEQAAAVDDRYTLTLSADDGDHDPTLKTYLLVLRGGGGTTTTTGCQDDSFEDNDTRADAAPLTPDAARAMVSCPVDSGSYADEDWYAITITTDTTVHLAISGTSATDLDLALYDSTGALLQKSETLTADEDLSRCLTPGTYYARVYAWSNAENDYLMAYDATAGACAAVCNDDPFEPDDDATNARPTTYPSFESDGNTICASDDWFNVPLYNAEHLTVDLYFNQAADDQDLDLHLINKNGTDLTPCHETNPDTCVASDGQGSVSNEHYEYTAPQSGCSAGCNYYVVVHGWNGSTNNYDVVISVQ